jgi:prevent-host-death family protein
MRSVGVGALRQNLSRYLRTVESGEELVVTARGRPVARMVPVTDAHADDAHMRELIQAGALRPRQQRLPRSFWTRLRAADPEGAVLRALLEERAEGR